MTELFLICALAVPSPHFTHPTIVGFVGIPDLGVIDWIVAHKVDFVVYGLRWFALSLLFAAFWIAWMYFFGHERDHDAEIEEEAEYWRKRKDDDEK